jgi:hypothetical protein
MARTNPFARGERAVSSFALGKGHLLPSSGEGRLHALVYSWVKSSHLRVAIVASSRASVLGAAFCIGNARDVELTRCTAGGGRSRVGVGRRIERPSASIKRPLERGARGGRARLGGEDEEPAPASTSPGEVGPRRARARTSRHSARRGGPGYRHRRASTVRRSRPRRAAETTGRSQTRLDHLRRRLCAGVPAHRGAFETFQRLAVVLRGALAVVMAHAEHV